MSYKEMYSLGSYFISQFPDSGSELHASPHIHIWIGHNHMWIYMDKTIWECALYVTNMKFLPDSGYFSATWLPKQVKQISVIDQGKLLLAELGGDFLEVEGKCYL